MCLTLSAAWSSPRFEWWSFFYKFPRLCIGVGCRLSYRLQQCNSVDINSPNYPLNYGHVEDCRWILLSEAGNTLTVTINEFETERIYDLLRIGNGNVVSVQSELQTFSGILSMPVDPVTSDGSAMWITFITDSDKTQKGFSMTVQDNCETCESN